MKLFKIFFVIIILLFIATLISCSSSKKTTEKEIYGRIYVLGNEPFTTFGIEDSNGTAYIIRKDSPVYKQLNKLQGKTVLVIIDINKSLNWDKIYITKIILNKKG